MTRTLEAPVSPARKPRATKSSVTLEQIQQRAYEIFVERPNIRVPFTVQPDSLRCQIFCRPLSSTRYPAKVVIASVSCAPAAIVTWVCAIRVNR